MTFLIQWHWSTRPRENSINELTASYLIAFQSINKDLYAFIIVVEKKSVIAVAQLNVIQYLTFQVVKRAQIEGVRVSNQYQRQGIGKRLFHYLIKLSKQHNCHRIQLTKNNERNDAHSFYKGLGFEATHSGFKLYF